MLIALLVLSIIANIFSGVVAYRALERATLCEDFAEAVLIRLAQIVTDIRYIDIRGSFEADDEVGDVFKMILHTIETLTEFFEEGDIHGSP